MKKYLLFSIILVLLLFLNTGKCKDNTFIYVDSNGEKEYISIQVAINNANENDIIQISNGIYNESIFVNKSITIRGEDKNSTILTNTIYILTDNAKITKLTIDLLNNSKNGINIMSDQNAIRENTISNCNIGINISNNSKNLIYHNNFINNTKNAEDSNNNNWYNKTLQQGNYWNDYEGLDKNLDGIGDNPYNISESNVKDKYPLMMPYEDFLRINERGFNLDELTYVLIIGGIISVIVLAPIAYYFRKKILKL